MSLSTQYRPSQEKSQPADSAQSAQDCCSESDDGAAICIVPEDGKTVPCGCASNTSNAEVTLFEPGPDEMPVASGPVTSGENGSTQHGSKIWNGVLFGIACVASPCCAPLYVPLVLGLLAGTPGAVWISANIGWVYGGLALISIATLVLGFRRLRPDSAVRPGVKTGHTSELQVPSTTNHS